MTDAPKKIAVCFVILKAYPIFNPDVKKVFGGAELDLYLLAIELAKDPAFDVSFVLGDYGQPAIEYRQGVRLIKSADPNKNLVFQAHKLWQAMKKADADIYMSEAASLGTSVIAAFCKLHRKFVYRTANQGECDGSFFANQKLTEILFKWSLQHAKLVFTQNQIDKQNLAKSFNINAHVTKNTHKIPENVNVSDDRDYILWVGRSTSLKRPELFIKLASMLPSERFVMICQQATGDKQYSKLVQHAKELNNLKFIDRVDFNDVETYFAKAKILASTSSSEGFPNVFVQACKFGVPILSLKVDPDDFMQHNSCGIACMDDWGKFIDAFKHLLQPEVLHRYALASLNYARENHDMDRIIEIYKELFRKI